MTKFSIVTFLVFTWIFSFSCKSNQSATSDSNVLNSTQVKSAEQTVQNNKASYKITENSIGDYSRGMAFDPSAATEKGEFVEKTRKSDGQNYYALMNGNAELLRIFPAIDPRTNTVTNIIGKVTTQSNKFVDEKGISVGSSIRAFQKSYPSAYMYYDMTNNNIILSNEGHGPQYIIDAKGMAIKGDIKAGKIMPEKIDVSKKIEEIRIVRSEQENLNAKTNKTREEQEIMENYLTTLTGKYYLAQFSENYYKIHKLQGDFYISECFEGDCNNRGKIVDVTKNDADFIALNVEGLSGNMVPSWTIKSENTGKVMLYVRDYNAAEDTWTDKVYEKGIE